MARSFSQAKRVLAFANALSLPLHRRGYAVGSDVSVRAGLDRIGSRNGMVVGKVEEKGVTKNGSETSSAWAPDPVTGYYRPINHMDEIDPVELRKILLNHKVRSSSP
ncbi:late embryogenesis abundant protein Lea5-like [Gastrolobium bilobum]|uniref:late embryogenesis abundant protein Lea5-like n=1 Tax=Gastrolobium bilobum TaxID=150636 RepID=UPI002AB2EF38|nr:late embryogenesis abundant protein Lea5-like [Gastrolobium bilobum]